MEEDKRNADKLLPFDFSEEVISRFRQEKNIPIDFYNNKGQVLIYKKENASEEEIDRLLKFTAQGIFFKSEDQFKLTGVHYVPETHGLSNTKLLSKKHTEILSDETNEVFGKLRESSSTAFSSAKMQEKMDSLFTDFSSQEEALVGLINIIELMSEKKNENDVELAIKRTVVAMAIKTRGMMLSRSAGNPKAMRQKINNLMMSALLCDIGYFKMELPQKSGLSKDEMSYIKSHPLVSYLMIAHDNTLAPEAKNNILMHHHSKSGQGKYNSYPQIKPMVRKLWELRQKYQGDYSKQIIVEDIEKQIQIILRSNSIYNEDSNILNLASEFASLTTKVPWRDPFSGSMAAKMILNNSLFTYTARILREFFDYIAMSLVDNQMIINKGDFVVVTSINSEGKAYFELCQIEKINRFQSRPSVIRFGVLEPIVQSEPKLKIVGFDFENIKRDRRHARYDLMRDDSRHLSYIFDSKLNPEHCEAIQSYCMN